MSAINQPWCRLMLVVIATSLVLLLQCGLVSGEDDDGNDDNDGGGEMSEEEQQEMDVGAQRGGWPYQHARGDSGHEPLFQVLPVGVESVSW
jgi:hypothetical protein